MCVWSCFSCVRLFVTLQTIAHQQALLSMGFSRQDYWTGLPNTSPGDLPNPGIEHTSSPLQADSLLLVHWWSPNFLGQKKEYALWEALGFFTYFIGDQWKISSRWALILYMDRSFRTSNVMHFYELDLRKLSLFLLARCWKHITDWYSLWGSCSQPLASALPRAP